MEPDCFGHIYRAHTARDLVQGIIKVGSSNNVSRRLRDLSSASGVHEEFNSWSWFRFESQQAALAVEKRVHAEFQKLGLHHRKEFYRDLNVFHDAVRNCAEDLGETCLSNYWLESGDIYDKFEAFLPCGYFLLSDPSELKRFLQFSFNMVQFISSLHNMDAGRNGFVSWAFQEPSRDLLRANARIPLVCANLRECPDQELVAWANDKIDDYEDEIFEVFGFDENWRDKVTVSKG